MSDPSQLDLRSRTELIQEALRLGVERPERMTRVELKDEILRRTKTGEELQEARGLFGVARSMLASVVESGLNLPDAAALIRGSASFDARVQTHAPVATVTLAEIYAAQGHKKRALRMLDEVLAQEPDHEVALRLRRELTAGETARSEEAPAVELRTARDDLVITSGEEIQTGPLPSASELASGLASDASSSAHNEPESAAAAAPEEPAPAQPEPPASAQSEPQGAEEQEGAALASVAAPLLIVQQSEEGIRLYWELSPEVVESAGIESSSGHASVRVVAFSPTGSRLQREERSIDLSQEFAERQGVLILREFPPPAVVRAAVGWQLSDAFVPLAVGRSWGEWEASEADGARVAELRARLLG